MWGCKAEEESGKLVNEYRSKSLNLPLKTKNIQKRQKMEIDRIAIGEVLERARERTDDESGAQPRLALGCFYDLDTNQTDHCEQCSHYQTTCKFYIDGFKIEKRHIQHK